MNEQPRFCSDSLSMKMDDVEYTQEYCALYKEVKNREIGYNTLAGRELYSNLGIENRVEYVVEGTLPIAKALMDFLMSDIPNTALLINAYQETGYHAEYLTSDRKVFKGHNGGSLKGTLSLVAENQKTGELTWFGYGVADVLWWSLKGTVLMFMEYTDAGSGNVAYKLRVIVFNRSSFINGIMDLGVFRSVVDSKVHKIITHIQESAKQYATGDREPIKNYEKLQTPEGHKFLSEVEMYGSIEKRSSSVPTAIDVDSTAAKNQETE